MSNLIPFNKSFSSSSKLVSLLQSRGLTIKNITEAENYLDNIGYYRLSAYMYPFLKIPKSSHQYKNGTTFSQVMTIYRFDKRLRMLIFNEIEKIEIAIRRSVMQITAQMTGDDFWITNSTHFANHETFNDTLRSIQKEYSHSKEDFIKHFRITYSNNFPPVWILGELLTIGNINTIYRNIKQNRIRKRIAKHFGLPIDVFESWLTIIAVTRNSCGHHSRVWNKQNAITPSTLTHPTRAWITIQSDPQRIYYNICIIKYFLDGISPDNDMTTKLRWLFIEFPNIDLRAMGFPLNWEMEPLWR